jgi:hypothetical protein
VNILYSTILYITFCILRVCTVVTNIVLILWVSLDLHVCGYGGAGHGADRGYTRGPDHPPRAHGAKPCAALRRTSRALRCERSQCA